MKYMEIIILFDLFIGIIIGNMNDYNYVWLR